MSPTCKQRCRTMWNQIVRFEPHFYDEWHYRTPTNIYRLQWSANFTVEELESAHFKKEHLRDEHTCAILAVYRPRTGRFGTRSSVLISHKAVLRIIVREWNKKGLHQSLKLCSSSSYFPSSDMQSDSVTHAIDNNNTRQQGPPRAAGAVYNCCAWKRDATTVLC